MSVRELVKVSGGLDNVRDFLRDAMTSQTHADVTLCCTGGRRFSAHRLVLSAASPYLQRILSAHDNPASHYDPITVILADVESNDLAAILGYVYTGCTAVSVERLEGFTSTAEALKIKIPEFPRPLTLSQNDSYLSTDEMNKYDGYYGDIPNYNSGINMTKSKLNEREYLQDISYQMPNFYDQLSNANVQLSQQDSQNLDNKHYHEFREVKKSRYYVANRVSASPWCQIIQPHHLPRIQPIILKNNNIGHTQDITQKNIEFEEKYEKSQEEIYESPTERISCVLTSHVEPFTAAKVYTKTNTATPPAVNREFINEPREDVSSSESLITLLGESRQGAKINLASEYCDERREASINENNNNNTTDTGRGENKCSICDKTFVSRSSLKVHTRLHSGDKPFRCKDCGKEFSQLRNYKYHRSIHEGTGEFSATCPECGKSFNDRGYLGSHMKIHRNRKEYVCNECGKSFNQRVAYNMHVRIHTGIKPHSCDECGKAFSRKMLLKQHLRTHSGERPYNCHICNKAFADRSNMTLHTRLHSGLKPYQCEICTKSFTKKHHLKTHINYHTGIKPYSCPNCSLSFSQSSNMRTHFKKCSIIHKSVDIHNEDKTYVNNHRISAFSAALTPPYSDFEPSSNAEREIIR